MFIVPISPGLAVRVTVVPHRERELRPQCMLGEKHHNPHQVLRSARAFVPEAALGDVLRSLPDGDEDGGLCYEPNAVPSCGVRTPACVKTGKCGSSHFFPPERQLKSERSFF